MAFYLYEVLALLFPIGVYCLVLAGVNRRASPLVMSGFWDTVGLLFAGSGFFLVTMPLLLTGFYLRSLDLRPSEPFGVIWFRHTLIWLLYYLLLVSGSAFMLLWRSRKTMIYNIDPDLFPHFFGAALQTMGLEASMRQRRVIIARLLRAQEVQGTAVREGLPAPAPRGERVAELELESFPALCHVTLHWVHFAPVLRQQMEKELQKKLENASPLDNPAAGWFLSTSGLIFGMLVMIVLTVYLRF